MREVLFAKMIWLTCPCCRRRLWCQTSLTRPQKAVSKGLVVPEGDFGSDVEGIKPIFIEVGEDERKVREALKHCRSHLGDNATILYAVNLPDSIRKMVDEQRKESGGPWHCYNTYNFYGWEDERVVAVTDGMSIMELITRAKTHLSVILVEGSRYAKLKESFQQAADLGLVEMAQLSAENKLSSLENTAKVSDS